MLTKAELFDQKYSRNSNIVKYYYSLKQMFSMWIYVKILFSPVMQSWIFSIITHQCHMIFQKSC